MDRQVDVQVDLQGEGDPDDSQENLRLDFVTWLVKLAQHPFHASLEFSVSNRVVDEAASITIQMCRGKVEIIEQEENIDDCKEAQNQLLSLDTHLLYTEIMTIRGQRSMLDFFLDNGLKCCLFIVTPVLQKWCERFVASQPVSREMFQTWHKMFPYKLYHPSITHIHSTYITRLEQLRAESKRNRLKALCDCISRWQEVHVTKNQVSISLGNDDLVEILRAQLKGFVEQQTGESLELCLYMIMRLIKLKFPSKTLSMWCIHHKYRSDLHYIIRFYEGWVDPYLGLVCRHKKDLRFYNGFQIEDVTSVNVFEPYSENVHKMVEVWTPRITVESGDLMLDSVYRHWHQVKCVFELGEWKDLTEPTIDAARLCHMISLRLDTDSARFDTSEFPRILLHVDVDANQINIALHIRSLQRRLESAGEIQGIRFVKKIQ